MSELKTRKEILIELHNVYLERMLKNELDYEYFKGQDKIVNMANAKIEARNSRDLAQENIRNDKRLIAIIDRFITIEG